MGQISRKISHNSGCPVQKPALSEVEGACLGGDFKIKKVSCHSDPAPVEGEESAVPRNSVAPSLSRPLRQDGNSPKEGAPYHAEFSNLGVPHVSPLLRNVETKSHPPKRRGELAEFAFMLRRPAGVRRSEVKPGVRSRNPERSRGISQFADCKNLWFYPHGSKKGSRFERFREAWGSLR